MLGPILNLNNNLCPFLTISNSSTETGSKSFVGVNVIVLSDVVKERVSVHVHQDLEANGQLTGSFFDLTQYTEEGGLHSVAV